MSDGLDPDIYTIFDKDGLVCIAGEEPSLLTCCRDKKVPSKAWNNDVQRMVYACCPVGYTAYIVKTGMTGCTKDTSNTLSTSENVENSSIEDEHGPYEYTEYPKVGFVCTQGDDRNSSVCCKDGKVPKIAYDHESQCSVFVCCLKTQTPAVVKGGVYACIDNTAPIIKEENDSCPCD